jgi:hypothetical protein
MPTTIQAVRNSTLETILREAVEAVITQVIERNDRILAKTPAERNELAKYVMQQAKAYVTVATIPMAERVQQEVDRANAAVARTYADKTNALFELEQQMIQAHETWESSDETAKRMRFIRSNIEEMIPLNHNLGHVYATQVARSRGMALAAYFGLQSIGSGPTETPATQG